MQQENSSETGIDRLEVYVKEYPVFFARLNELVLPDPRLDKYPASVRQGFQWLKQTDLANLPLGKPVIDGDRVYANVFKYTTRPVTKAVLESHRLYIDIQVVIAGSELMGTVRYHDRLPVEKPYDKEADVEFYPRSIMPFLDGYTGANPQERLFEASAMQCAVFAVGDIHVSGLYNDHPREVHKLVVKCRIDA
ncbi:MAG: YhcH/YjgK/YiaL family protein [Thermoguttaceae bacterium]|nr:YhcH/YjgK/YiaL family protein [Thermoguttaceae bacterium]